MESLNLNTLASTLPAGQQKSEKDLLNNFKAAALSITTLYRSSRAASKRAYSAGYAAACQDLMRMIQQGVSTGGIDSMGGTGGAEGQGMSIGKIMDWIDARMEAMRAQEEEEDEEEEREKAPKASTSGGGGGSAGATAGGQQERKARNENAQRQPHTQPSSSPSPPPPPAQHAHALRPTQPHQRDRERGGKQARVPLKISAVEPAGPSSRLMSSTPNSTPVIADVTQPGPPAPSLAFLPPPAHQPFEPIQPIEEIVPVPFPDAAAAVGAKRRHAVMMMLDSAGAGTSASSTGSHGGAEREHGHALRRRTRSTRELRDREARDRDRDRENAMDVAMAMDEDGPARKRVARR